MGSVTLFPVIPKMSEMELPVLKALDRLGGKGKPKQVYPLVQAEFPGLTEEDLAEKLKHGESAFNNRVQWARQRLIEAGDMGSGGRGIWVLTDQGRARLKSGDGAPACPDVISPMPNLGEVHEQYISAFERRLRQKLLDLAPAQFERFGKLLMTAYGFEDVQVTQVSNDGGIDGHGRLRLGLATLRAAFQCKRWTGNVPRDEVDKFRGATQGRFEQGLFFTTSDFTGGARDASLRPGAIPIILFNGERLVRIMIEKQIGVSRVPLYLLDDDDLDVLIDADASGD